METYALITAAYNEAEHIEKTLRSVTSQTVLPGKWIIVSDGSTDRTDEIVQKYAKHFSFIQLVRQERDQRRNFASKVFAQNAGIRLLSLKDFDFIGLMDGDASFAPDYFRVLFKKFRLDPALGLASGYIYEAVDGHFFPVKGNRKWSVPGCIQMFRRECFERIGGLLPIKYGCVDTYLEIAARMRGWKGQSFSDLVIRHHRPCGGAVGVLRYSYRKGLAEYSIGYHPAFEFVRLARRALSLPFALGALAQLCGFAVASLRREKREVSPEFVAFLRREQKGRLLPFGHHWVY
jgi:glycosyltransferase involved in cell wall biosynthesis